MPELEGRITGDPSGFIKASRTAQTSLGRLTKKGAKSGKSLSKSFKKARDAFNKVGKAAAGAALKVGVLAAAAGTAALAATAVKSINLAREQIRVEKQLAAVLKSTGGAAGLTAKELTRHAAALQKVTNFGDEVTIGAQAMLLTFTKIGRDIFPRATEAIQDMAVAMQIGLKEATLQVGKALNDPIRGMTALTRSGITFTQQQKDQVKALQETGQLMKAQTIIIKELETQFGGSARAAADPLIQLKNVVGDLGEEIGKGLIPIVNAFAKAAIPVFAKTGAEFKALAAIIKKRSANIEEAFGGIGETATFQGGLLTLAFDNVAAALRSISEPLAGAITGFEILLNTAQLAVSGFRQLALAGQLAAAAIRDFTNSTEETRQALANAEVQLAEAARRGAELKDALTLDGITERFNEIKGAIDGTADSVKDFSEEIKKQTADQAKLGEEVQRTTTRLREQQEAFDKTRTGGPGDGGEDRPPRRRRRGGGRRGRLTLGIAGPRRQGQASFPGLTGAAGQFGTVGSRHFGGQLTRSGVFTGQRGEFVIKRSAAQAIGPDLLRRLNRGGDINVTNNINASDRSSLGTRAQIRAMLPELRRQTKLGVRQGGPF